MATFADYADQGYLPGSIYRYTGRAKDPLAYSAINEAKLWEFKPSKDNGNSFNEFLAIANNPDLLMQGTAKMPQGFNNSLKMMIPGG